MKMVTVGGRLPPHHAVHHAPLAPLAALSTSSSPDRCQSSCGDDDDDARSLRSERSYNVIDQFMSEMDLVFSDILAEEVGYEFNHSYNNSLLNVEL